MSTGQGHANGGQGHSSDGQSPMSEDEISVFIIHFEYCFIMGVVQ